MSAASEHEYEIFTIEAETEHVGVYSLWVLSYIRKQMHRIKSMDLQKKRTVLDEFFRVCGIFTSAGTFKKHLKRHLFNSVFIELLY